MGQWRFQRVGRQPGQPLFALAFGVRWALPNQQYRRYTFLAMEDTQAFAHQLQEFRATLLGWLIAAAMLLLLAQLVVLRWGLSPLRKLTSELRSMEAGQKEELTGRHPDELRPLSEALNALLRSERSRQTRYRNALADLAHSLKTPLAVMRGLIDPCTPRDDHSARLDEQIARMDQIVEYQLKRAAAAGGPTTVRPVELRPLVAMVSRSLAKVYHQKPIDYGISVPADLKVHVDEGDLVEILGNVMDNASRFCRRCVRVGAAVDELQLNLHIDDDGTGFPPDQRDALLARGVRMDTRSAGQGIGLSVVAEIIKAYRGSIRLEDSPLGGARVSLCLPV